MCSTFAQLPVWLISSSSKLKANVARDIHQTNPGIVEALHLRIAQLFLPAPCLRTTTAVSRTLAGPAYGPNLRRRDSFLEPSCDDHSVDLPCILSLADRLCDDVQLFCGQMGCHRACDNKLANSYRHNGKRMSTTGFRANGYGMNIYCEVAAPRAS